MVYKVGKMTYNSVGDYQNLLAKIWGVFLICLWMLFVLKDNMYGWMFDLVLVIDIAMLIHLMLKYGYSKNWFKYPFHEY